MATQVQTYEEASFERASALTVRANTDPDRGAPRQDEIITPDQRVERVLAGILIPRGEVYFNSDSMPVRAVLSDANFGEAGIVEREGLAAQECDRFEQGSNRTLYTPLYFRILPATDSRLILAGQVQGELHFKATNKAVQTQDFDIVKVEVGVLMRQAADRAYGISKTRRTQLHEYIDENVIGDRYWTPTKIGDSAPQGGSAINAICIALIHRAQDIAKIEQDHGKVWRNRDTVNSIRKAALTIAAGFNDALIRNGLIQ